MSEHILTVLQPEQVEEQWAQIRALLEPVQAHCHGELTVDDVLDLVRDRRAFVLTYAEGGELALVGAFEVIQYPRRRVINAMMIGGKKLGVVLNDFMGDVVKYGKTVGADAVRGYVRPSVARLVRRSKAKPKLIYSVVEIELC